MLHFKYRYVLSLILIIGSQFTFAQTNLAFRRACYQSSAADYDHVAHLVTDGDLKTTWISKTANTEWLYVDLGVACDISSISIAWDKLYAKAYSVQITQEGSPENPVNWRNVYHKTHATGSDEQIKLSGARARYVKVICNRSATTGYAIKELKVNGKGGLKYVNKPNPPINSNGRQYLTGGNWKLQRYDLVTGTGKDISKANYNDEDWVPATVPGTILSSYLNIGALPNPNYGAQQLMISDDFFTADFWYRNNFNIPGSYRNKRIWINFDGINWKADVYINGKPLGNIKGAFIRGRFDITDYVKAGEATSLAVLIHKNDNPGKVTEQHLHDADNNGGIIGYDSPTYLASIGWNWMPTGRGRNTGIWSDVYLTSTAAVTMDDPFVKTDLALPDTSIASLSIQVQLTNHNNSGVNGTLKGTIGALTLDQPISLTANETKTVVLNPVSHPQLNINHPKLWWPNGYGEQNLYQLNLTFNIQSESSDQKQVVFGIRKYTYSYDNNNLHIRVNGYPIILRGGNWGMADAMLRCDKEGYDIRVKLHKDMNLNMIRNWIGMEGNDAFYDACDKYGIMIWDDFWLANPVDGPHPKDESMFMANVKDKIHRRRNHASLALWCGRNEGYPPATLDSALRVETNYLDGTRTYISSSAHLPVTGLGPYETKDPKWYFKNRGTTFHSEQGIVAVPTLESMKAMMPADSLWPVSDMWGKHDWTQPRVTIYNDDLERSYGKATGIADFCEKAQMMNMEGPKALMETWRSNRGPGVLVWMTQPAWPSLICQTYDYYFEPNAAYFAFKNANEPIHVLWRADNETIEVANDTRSITPTLTIEASVFGLNGKLTFSKTLFGTVAANSVKSFLTLPAAASASAVDFISLKVKDAAGYILSTNFYWRGGTYKDYTALQSLPKVALSAKATMNNDGTRSTINLTLTNNTGRVALMARLKVVQQKTGKRVLPAFYTDNYVSLTPGEKRRLTITFDNKYLEDDNPILLLEGWNIKDTKIPLNKPSAKAGVLQYLYVISGTKTLTGQHNDRKKGDDPSFHTHKIEMITKLKPVL